jgi:hypothetical protein
VFAWEPLLPGLQGLTQVALIEYQAEFVGVVGAQAVVIIELRAHQLFTFAAVFEAYDVPIATAKLGRRCENGGEDQSHAATLIVRPAEGGFALVPLGDLSTHFF